MLTSGHMCTLHPHFLPKMPAEITEPKTRLYFHQLQRTTVNGIIRGLEAYLQNIISY